MFCGFNSGGRRSRLSLTKRGGKQDWPALIYLKEVWEAQRSTNARVPHENIMKKNVYLQILTEGLPSLRHETKSVGTVYIEVVRRAAGAARCWVFASVSELARETGLSVRTIYRALRRLEDLGLIARESGGGRRKNRLTVLALANEVVSEGLGIVNAGDVSEPSVIAAADVKIPAAAATLPVTAVSPDQANAPAAPVQDFRPTAQTDNGATESLAVLARRAFRALDETEIAELMSLGDAAKIGRILKQMAWQKPKYSHVPMWWFLGALKHQLEYEQRWNRLAEDY